MIDTRIYDDSFLLAKIFEHTELNKDEKERLYKHFEKRKKGRWITKSTNGEMFDVCSACGYVEWDEPHNYCPNCGAEMVNSDE